MEKENDKVHSKSWHQRHVESLSFGQKLSDKITFGMGSWKFIITQTIIVIFWIGLNLVGLFSHWDPFPFILLNLLFSTQAAYAAPIIMMSQNRQSERDRLRAEEDYETNVIAKNEIEEIQRILSRIEIEKLDKILEIVREKK